MFTILVVYIFKTFYEQRTFQGKCLKLKHVDHKQIQCKNFEKETLQNKHGFLSKTQ